MQKGDIRHTHADVKKLVNLINFKHVMFVYLFRNICSQAKLTRYTGMKKEI